ncbi:MAG: dephospho-CoA kinase [Ferruginibacter sp.]|nr:dephospho-CoA kinase [Ferruginibacter sp.]
MLRIGITGGIGSGKTTVARIFEVLGIPVYYADDAAKRLMNEDEELQQKIIENFGPEVYENKQLNRTKLASLVFNDPQKLALLNTLVHPATIADAENWMKNIGHENNSSEIPFAIKEAALLFESGAQKNLDYVIGVNAPYKLRLQRAMKRDKLTKEAVESRLNKQMDETKKMNLCNFIITNDEEQLLIPQVEELYRKLLNL